MELDSESEGSRSSSADASDVVKPSGPWLRFWKTISEPWTCILLIVSVALFVIGQQNLSAGVTALIQILLAVASGVLGARVTNQLEAASGKSILEARGKVAVRGLKLMLVQTAAFQRRLDRFLNARDHIENHPEVTARNYEEVIEFCRRIQEEAASAMETWGDIVPTTDLSSLIGRITEAEDQRDTLQQSLQAARVQLDQAAGNAVEADQLRNVVQLLEEQAAVSNKRLKSLVNRLESLQLASEGQPDARRMVTNLGLTPGGIVRLGEKIGGVGGGAVGVGAGRITSLQADVDK